MISFFLFYDITGNTFLVSKILVHDTVFWFLCFFCQYIRKLGCLSRKLHWPKSFGTCFTVIMEYSLQSAPTPTRRLNPCVSFSPFLRAQGEGLYIICADLTATAMNSWKMFACSKTCIETIKYRYSENYPRGSDRTQTTAEKGQKSLHWPVWEDVPQTHVPLRKKNLLWGFLTSYMLIQINQRAEKSN